MVWATAWDSIKPVEVHRGDIKVHQVKSSTKELRELLQPLVPGDYDMPRVGTPEIELFKSLLNPSKDWVEELNQVWSQFHYLYEQELDPRVFQQQAREGALRDNLLSVLPKIPEAWGDFVVLLCHRVFSRMNTKYMERFVRNFGTNEEKQTDRMPYLMRYLHQARDRPEIRKRERRDEAAWRDQVNELRRYLTGRKREKGDT